MCQKDKGQEDDALIANYVKKRRLIVQRINQQKTSILRKPDWHYVEPLDFDNNLKIKEINSEWVELGMLNKNKPVIHIDDLEFKINQFGD